MGHSSAYLDLVDWDERLTLADRIERGPFQSAFGAGHSDAAAGAVEQARHAHEVAAAVFDQVKEQAVYALLTEGVTIRGIAERVGIPKTEVGRIARALGRVDDRPGSRPAQLVAAGPKFRDELRDRVRLAWGHR